MNLADAPDVLLVREAAALARVSANRMYQLIRDGEIPAARGASHGTIRVLKTSVVAWLAGETPANRPAMRVVRDRRRSI